MSESVSREELLTALEHAAGQLGKAADELNRLDSAVGDGDMGVTITLGCRAVQNVLPELADQDIGTIIAKCGMAFNRAGPSTLGALLAIGAMRAGKEARGTQELTPAMLVSMLRVAQAGIVEKGKAQPGDKTMLDALGPSINALEMGLSEAKTLREAARAAVEAARAGVEATIAMKARSGRAAWITERTLGHPDPGAVVVLRAWEAFTESTARPE